MIKIKRKHYRYLRNISQNCILFTLFLITLGGYLLLRGGAAMVEPEGELLGLAIRPFAYNFTPYLFTYTDHFIKRGLIGEIFSQLFNSINYTFVKEISIGFLIGLTSLLIYLFSRPLRQYGYRCGHYWFMLLAICSPATLMRYAYDLGRFDIIILILVIITIYLITEIRSRWLFFMVLLLTSIMILIHEGALFFFIPTIFAYWFYCDSNPKTILLQGIGLTILIGFTLYIMKYGLLTANFEEHLKSLQEIYGEKSISHGSLRVLYNGNIDGNIALTKQMIANKRHVTHWIIFLLATAPFFKLLFLFASHFIKTGQRKVVILMCTSMTPLLLIPVAFDHFRWWALSFTNFFIIFSFLMIYNNQIAKEIAKILERHQRLLLIIILISLIVGPLADYRSFDDLFTYDLFVNIIYFFENIVFG